MGSNATHLPAEASAQAGLIKFLQSHNNFYILISSFVFLGAGCSSFASVEPSDLTFNFPSTEESSQTVSWEFPGILSDEEIQQKQIRIKTDKGEIVFELFADTAPKTVSNFVYLITGGFYNGLTFHRREEGFVIQGGDPNGDGSGGPGYTFEDELSDARTYERGIVAMANRGPNTNGSQFFIMLADTPLPKSYTIFGRVIEGMEIVDQIQVGDVMKAVTIENLE